jgi:hypothetical protein
MDIKISQAVDNIEKYLSSEILEQKQSDTKHKTEEQRAHLDGIREFYKLRRKWSWFILGCIGTLVIFQITVTFLVGFNHLNFIEYKWFLPLVITILVTIDFSV